jgi:5-methylcytosine-specific restriction endonuclease McrA
MDARAARGKASAARAGSEATLMMQQYRAQYPERWEELSRECKERANWQCSHCGVKQYEIVLSKRGRPYMIYLHAAHKNHDKSNPNPELVCLCISCHAKLDYQHKQRAARVHLEHIKHLRRLIEIGVVEVTAYL